MTNIYNPFNTGSPATPELFFGRNDIIQDIYLFLENPSQNTFFINGQRRMGKTSLLRKLQYLITKKGFTPIYYDLQNKAEDTLHEVLLDLMQTINIELDNSFDINPDKVDNAIKYFETVFLNGILSKKIKIVILFDEFDVLGDKKTILKDNKTKNLAYVRFVPHLHDLICKNLPIKFIFAIGRSIDDLADYYGPIKKFAQVRKLSFFSYEESKGLINKLTKEKIIYPEQTIQKVHKITNGYPFFLQCLCSFLFDKAIEKNENVIRLDDVNKYLIPTMKKYSGGLNWFWEAFRPEEKVYIFVIAKLIEDNTAATEQSIIDKCKNYEIQTSSPEYIKVLDKLIRTGVIKKNKSYYITVPIIQIWIAKEHTVERIKSEALKVDKVAQDYFNIGKVLFEEQNYEEAIEPLKNVLKRVPDNFEAQFYLAHALNNCSKDQDEDLIISEFEKAYAMNNNFVKDSYVAKLRECYEKNQKKNIYKKLQR